MLPPARTRSVQFPRPKIYLSHLNQLIDRKVVVQPEIQVTNKLFPQRDFAKRLATSHQRTKSSIQLRSQRFDLHWTTKRAKNMLVQNSKQPVLVQSSQMKLEMPQAKSSIFHRNDSTHFKDEGIKFYSTYTGMSHTSSQSPQGNPASSQPVSPQKNFLRRGSNIQKQIVINLLRNKLMREREVCERKEYSNNEIIKMIQVFKGVALDQYTKKALAGNQIKEINQNRKKDVHRELRGWDHDHLNDYELT